MSQELVPQQNSKDTDSLKTFLIAMYNDPQVRQFITYTLRPFSEKQIDLWLSSHVDDNVRYFSFIQNDHIAGLAIVGEHEERGCELIGLLVLPDYQGQGIGRTLVQHVFQLAKQSGWLSIDVRVFADNKKMLKLMIDEDFIPVRMEYHKRADGTDVVHLKKHLSF